MFRRSTPSGEACAPVDAAGFGLSFTPDGADLIIGEGRIYIDGLLVENHHGSWVDVEAVEGRRGVLADLAPDGIPFAAGQWVEVSWDGSQTGAGSAVGKITDVDATSITLDFMGASVESPANPVVRRLVTYLTQPYYHAGAPPPIGDPFLPGQLGGQTLLFYLDVWRRHVTAVEDPRIREVALGGPDTATRAQTAWALRFLTVVTPAGSVPFDATGMACHDAARFVGRPHRTQGRPDVGASRGRDRSRGSLRHYPRCGIPRSREPALPGGDP